MSDKYYIPPAQETYETDGTYQSKFLTWRAFVDRNAILRAIMNANADAVTASWRTYGKNAKQVADILDNFRGTGKETFKLIFNNAIKVAKIGGDYYGEIIYDEVDGIEGDVPTDIITLPPDRIRQVIKKGRIRKYEEIHTGQRWKPQAIFHLAYNPIGSQTHGNSVIEPMNNLLIHMESLMESGSKIFDKYVKPMNVIYTKTDSATEMAKIKDVWKATMNTSAGDMFVPTDVVEKIERVSIPQYSTLDPAHWHRVLLDHLIMGSRVPELALGTGSVNSEESARMQYMGFRQMIRWDQKFLEENMRWQVFNQIYPEDTPSIKFSFAAEAQEERYERLMRTMQAVGNSMIPETLKPLLQVKILIEMGLIPDV